MANTQTLSWLEREKIRIDLEIRNKFSSKKWQRSPYRNHKYALKRYLIQTEDTCHQPITQTIRDIQSTLDRRAFKAKTEPSACWDYVTNTLSEKEMRRVVLSLLRLRNAERNSQDE